MMHNETTYILASTSPRRKQLLSYLNLANTLQYAVETDETIEGHWMPSEAVIRLSINKGLAVFQQWLQKDENVKVNTAKLSIISADTIVVRDNQILGKPADEAEAFHILKSLQGRSHEVFTGLTVLHVYNDKLRYNDEKVTLFNYSCHADIMTTIDNSWTPFGQIGYYKCISQVNDEYSLFTGYIKSNVTFRPLTDQHIIDYIHTGDPLDKAGAYGIQGIGAVNIESIDGDFYSVMGLPLSLLHHIMSLSERENKSKNL